MNEKAVESTSAGSETTAWSAPVSGDPQVVAPGSDPAPPVTGAAATAGRAPDRPRPGMRPFTRRGLTAAGAVLAAGLLYWFLCWVLSSTVAPSSDGASIALQGWDMGHHNSKLRHWITGDANFYTFETPLYAVAERIAGLGVTTMHVVSALTYTLVMLVAAWLAKGEERGMRAYARFGLVAALLVVPMYEGALTGTLLGAPDHIGTSVFILGGYLLCDRASGRRGATWCLFALLTLGQLGDVTVKYVGVLPIVLVCVSRPLVTRRLRSPDWWMAVAAASSVPGEAVLRAAMRTWGAYSMVPPQNQPAPAHLWLGHLHSTLIGLLTLFNIPYWNGTPVTALNAVGAVLGAAVLLAAFYGFVRTIARWPRAAAADQLLAVGIPVYLAAFAFSDMVLPRAGSAYEFVGVIPMIVVLAARNLPLPAPNRVPLVVAVSALSAVALFATDFRPDQAVHQETVAAWLKAHGLKYGIAGYWDAASTTVASGGGVAVRAVAPTGNHKYAVYAWVTKTTWYDPSIYDARFFIADPSIAGLGVADVEAAYGRPQGVYEVAGRYIVVYQINLLSTLVQTPVPDF